MNASNKFLLSALLLLVPGGSSWAQAPDPKPPCPKLPQMTYDEDAQFLRSDCRTSFPDPIQFIPLGQNEKDYLSFGFWIRARGEFVCTRKLAAKTTAHACLH